MHAFYNGINLGWVAGIFIALFVTGGVQAASMCVLPERYHFRFNKGNIFIWGALAAITGLAGMITILIMTVSMDDLKTGKHWKTECQLMEVNIQTDTFSEPVNKLDCAGVILNVPAKSYYRYIAEWQWYEAKNK